MSTFDAALKELRKRVKANTNKVFSVQSFSEISGIDPEKIRKWEQGNFPRDEKDRDYFRKLFQVKELADIPDRNIGVAAVVIAEQFLPATINKDIYAGQRLVDLQNELTQDDFKNYLTADDLRNKQKEAFEHLKEITSKLYEERLKKEPLHKVLADLDLRVMVLETK